MNFLPCLNVGVYGTGVWTGQQAVYWDSSNARFTAFSVPPIRVTPATSTCAEVSPVDAPVARNYYTAVWTGAAMLVWGGWAWPNRQDLGDGAGYDPDTDTWRPLASDGAPTPRDHHTAVWTGDEMIIWGGTRDYDHPNPLGDGARYFPPGSTGSLATAWGG